MLQGIREKLAMLIDDIEKEVGKESALYVYAWDIYADLLEYKGHDLSDDLFKGEKDD